MYVAASVDAEPTIKDANVMPAVTDNTFFRVKIETSWMFKKIFIGYILRVMVCFTHKPYFKKIYCHFQSFYENVIQL